MNFITTLTYTRKQHENDDIYTFYFSTAKKINHRAGQHGVFLLPGFYRPHPFSLSSSPDEPEISFSTHTSTGSRYKQKLMNMNPGDKIYMIGPVLNFTFIDGKKDYVLLAQGIGITPFRSMLTYAHSKQLPVKTTLIHVDSVHHTFRDITERYATNAHYPTTSDQFRTVALEQPKNQLFYISGSPKFVMATKQLLTDSGVESNNIKTDSFLGY